MALCMIERRQSGRNRSTRLSGLSANQNSRDENKTATNSPMKSGKTQLASQQMGSLLARSEDDQQIKRRKQQDANQLNNNIKTSCSVYQRHTTTTTTTRNMFLLSLVIHVAITCSYLAAPVPVAEAASDMLSLFKTAPGAALVHQRHSRPLHPVVVTTGASPSADTLTGGQQQVAGSLQEKVCQVKDGESVAIVEIEESRGSDVNQTTNPVELPISGSVGDGNIELKIESEAHKYFQIDGKQLKLIRPLDRDAVLKECSTLAKRTQALDSRNESSRPGNVPAERVSSIYMQISCLDKRQSKTEAGRLSGQSDQPTHKKVIIPVLVKVLDLNDNAPRFSAPMYSVQVDELTPTGSIVVDSIQALDTDSANNGLIEFSLQPLKSTGATWSNMQQFGGHSSAKVVQRDHNSDSSLTTTTTSMPLPLSSSSLTPSVQITTTSISFIPSSDSEKSSTSGLLSTTRQSSSSPSISGPSINLLSEPIHNGPISEPEMEEEGEEAILASLNSTTNGMDPSDGSGSFRGRARKRRARRSIGSTSGPPTTSAGSTTRASRDLWTNLLAEGVGVELAGSGPVPLSTDHLSAQSYDPSEYFALEVAPQLNGTMIVSRPIIRLKKQLDYESRRVHLFSVVARDRANRKEDRRQSSATIVVRVLDGDDQGPVFVLDQVGCATSSPLATSGPSSLPVTESSVSGVSSNVVKRELGGGSSGKKPVDELDDDAGEEDDDDDDHDGERLEHNRKHRALPRSKANELKRDSGSDIGGTGKIPRGFKVTEENFDFSDVGPEVEQATGGGVAGSVAKPSGDLVAARAFFPATVTVGPTFVASRSTPSYQLVADYTCLLGGATLTASGTGSVEYQATVMAGDSDYNLRIAPQAIKARDRDELNAPIRYSFVNGTPSNYSSYFQINSLDASVKQVLPVESNGPQRFVLTIEAQEQAGRRSSSYARLNIEVVPSDRSPPLLVPNSQLGFVNENSPVGSNVMLGNGPGEPSGLLRIRVLDQSRQQQLINPPGDSINLPISVNQQTQAAGVSYEFETTSDAFKVNKEGYVYVNRWPLDRDPATGGQALHLFQVTARQVGLASARSLSAPVSLNVSLLDLNDNPPELANSSLVPIRMAAAPASQVQQVRQLIKIEGSDKDSTPEQSRMLFAIKHVSNGGRDRFRLHEHSGQLEALGGFRPGEQFSLTIQVSDELGRSSQAILEVIVTPGPNQAGPQFVIPTSVAAGSSLGSLLSLSSSSGSVSGSASSEEQQPGGQVVAGSQQTDNSRGYQVEVSESVAPGSAILQLTATDPENDPITYALVGGNVNGDFRLEPNTGQLFTVNKLDREEVSAYQLLAQARDPSGLATIRPVKVIVTDVNDQNPSFERDQYLFEVEEGVMGKTVGRVGAIDNDWAENKRVSYSLERSSIPVDPLTREPLFEINPTSGELKLIRPLDFERSPSHSMLVVARDHGEPPRSGSATIQIRVIDVQDEMPYFERPHYELHLDENTPTPRQLIRLVAHDPDSVAQVTYELRSGDPSLFQVDSRTGQVSLVGELDYELAKRHTLIVGLTENKSPFELIPQGASLSDQIESRPTKWSACQIDLLIDDLNDNRPQFVSQPLPVRIQDTATLGTQLIKLQAVDLDGSEPNNVVRYFMLTGGVVAPLTSGSNNQPEMATQSDQSFTTDTCAHLFMVDPNSGQVSLRGDLKRASGLSECQLVIEARDAAKDPQNQLSSRPHAQLTVFIDHLAELWASGAQLGFGDSLFTVELYENSPPGTLVKLLPVVNKPSQSSGSPPITCELVVVTPSSQKGGGQQGATAAGSNLDQLFQVGMNEQRDCELRLGQEAVIDYEQRKKYSLAIRLKTVGADPSKSLTQVQVNVLDVNDNKPHFRLPSRYSHLSGDRYLAAIASDAASESQVIQVEASDADLSPQNGQVTYELINRSASTEEAQLEASSGSPELLTSSRFSIEPTSGIIRTTRPLEDVPATRLPLRLRVRASDHPIESKPKQALAEVVVNLIDDRHRFVVVLRDSPVAKVLEARDELLAVLQERTGLIPGLERIESMKVLRNGSLEADVAGSDLWIHLIEPASFRIVQTDDPRLKAALLESRGQSSLQEALVKVKLSTGRSSKVRLPYSLGGSSLGLPIGAGETARAVGVIGAAFASWPPKSLTSIDGLSSVLIILALLIALVGAFEVVYQCGGGEGRATGAPRVGCQAEFGEKLAAQQYASFVAAYNNSTAGSNPIKRPPGSHMSFDHFRPPYAPASFVGSQFGKSCDSSVYQLVGGPARSSIATGSNGLDPSDYATAQTIAAANKEYETQMLKMSVIFDDANSLDGQQQQQQQQQTSKLPNMNHQC